MTDALVADRVVAGCLCAILAADSRGGRQPRGSFLQSPLGIVTRTVARYIPLGVRAMTVRGQMIRRPISLAISGSLLRYNLAGPMT